MASLSDITAEVAVAVASSEILNEETGELVFDPSAIDALAMPLEEKVDGICWAMRRREADIDLLKAEEKRLAERRRALEKGLASLKSYTAACLTRVPDERVKTARNTAFVRRTKSVQVLDEGAVPDGFKVVKTTESVDKKAVRTALEGGEDVPGACLTVNVGLGVR